MGFRGGMHVIVVHSPLPFGVWTHPHPHDFPKGLCVLDTSTPLESRVQEQFAILHEATVALSHAQPQLLPQVERVLDTPKVVQEQFSAEHVTAIYSGGSTSSSVDEFVTFDALEWLKLTTGGGGSGGAGVVPSGRKSPVVRSMKYTSESSYTVLQEVT